MIITLGSEMGVFIDQLGFLDIIDGCSFTSDLAYLAYSRSSKVDWEALGMNAPFRGYYFLAGSVDAVPEPVFPGHCLRLDVIGFALNSYGFSVASIKWLPGKTTMKAA